MAADYYTSRRSRLLQDFDRFSDLLGEVISSFYGDDLAPHIVRETRAEFEDLIPQLPYIGGDKNPQTRDVIGTSYGLALYRALTARGKTAHEIGRVSYALAEARFASMPWTSNLAFRLMRALLCTRLGKRLFKVLLRRRAKQSQQDCYPGGAVAYFVEGVSGEFDCGVDITECPIVNFFRGQGAGEFARYVCLYDFVASKFSGTGLVRTMTLAEGADRCDDRFRLGQMPENRQKTQISIS